MNRDFFDPSPEEQHIVLIDAKTLPKGRKAHRICEQCNPEGAEIPFDNILNRGQWQGRRCAKVIKLRLSWRASTL
jgi:hypothetical protein